MVVEEERELVVAVTFRHSDVFRYIKPCEVARDLLGTSFS